MRGNYDLGVVVGMASRSVLKGVRSSENGICGFKCTLSGKLLLVGCESGDSTPYLRAQVCVCSFFCLLREFSSSLRSRHTIMMKSHVALLCLGAERLDTFIIALNLRVHV